MPRSLYQMERLISRTGSKGLFRHGTGNEVISPSVGHEDRKTVLAEAHDTVLFP